MNMREYFTANQSVHGINCLERSLQMNTHIMNFSSCMFFHHLYLIISLPRGFRRWDTLMIVRRERLVPLPRERPLACTFSRLDRGVIDMRFCWWNGESAKSMPISVNRRNRSTISEWEFFLLSSPARLLGEKNQSTSFYLVQRSAWVEPVDLSASVDWMSDWSVCPNIVSNNTVHSATVDNDDWPIAQPAYLLASPLPLLIASQINNNRQRWVTQFVT